ncbi:MAG: SgcJ/EcaC family oxidoreductase [Gammaproteobacteria bacterium]
MKTKLSYCLLGGLLAVTGCQSPGAGSSSDTPAAVSTSADKAAVLAVVQGFEDAWNRHDMDAFAALFHEDAAWVHWRGGYWRGRDEIKNGHLAIHQTFYKNSHMQTIAVEDVTFLTPIVAVTHDRADLTGDERSPGQLLRYRKTMVITNRSGLWRISAGHNTRLQDEIE